jgi:hypothetical protein
MSVGLIDARAVDMTLAATQVVRERWADGEGVDSLPWSSLASS